MNPGENKRSADTRSLQTVFEVKPSSIDGKGLFARSHLPAGKKLGELTGRIISLQEARRRARRSRRIAIVEFPNGKALDASAGGNEFRYANHSCSPNTFIRIFRGRVEFYALRNIEPGEEITANYGATQHNGMLRCNCASDRCQGYL